MPIVVGAAIALSAVGCAAFMARDDVAVARSAWRASPTPARVQAYAQMLHGAFAANAYAHHAAEFRQQVLEVLPALADAARSDAPRAATLVGYGGTLLLDVGRAQEGWAELGRSMAMGPTLVSAMAVVPAWGERNRSDNVAAICARTLPALGRADDRFRLLEVCVRSMHASSDAAALAWAPAGTLAFYRAERGRRAAALANQRSADMTQTMDSTTQSILANQAAQQASDLANQAAMDASQQAVQMATSPP